MNNFFSYMRISTKEERGLRVNTIRLLANKNQQTILWVGSKMMIKRSKMELYLDRIYEVDTLK